MAHIEQAEAPHEGPTVGVSSQEVVVGRLAAAMAVPEVGVTYRDGHRPGFPFIAKAVIGVGLGLGVAGGAVSVMASSHIRHEAVTIVNEIPDVGYTPHPGVSSGGTEALIAANNALEDYGPWAMLGLGAVGVGAYAYGRTRHGAPLSDLAQRMERGNGGSHRRSKAILAATVAGFAANAAGMGAVTSDGANKPVQEVLSALGLSSNTPVVTQYEGQVPFSAGGLSDAGYRQLNQIVVRNIGGQVIPVRFELGTVQNPSSNTNPSSAPITQMPTSMIDKAFDVRLPVDASCDNLQVVVGKQLGVRPGSTVVVDGEKAEVAGTVNMSPGLDRVAVFAPIENQCLFPDAPYTEAILSGTGHSVLELRAQLKSAGLDFNVTDFSTLEGEYKSFWEHSVQPPEMQLLALVLILGAAATGYMQKTSISANQKFVAGLMANKVSRSTIQRAALLGAIDDISRTVILAAPLTVGLAYITDSSQFGLNMPANVQSLGAGCTTYTIARLLAHLSERRVIGRIDTAEEIRNSQ